jgi:hypothetical protein
MFLIASTKFTFLPTMSEQVAKRMKLSDDLSVKVKVYSEKFGELKDFYGPPFIRELSLIAAVEKHLDEKEEKAKILLEEKQQRVLTFIKTVFPEATKVDWKEKKKRTKTDIYYTLKIIVFLDNDQVFSLAWKSNIDLGDENSAAAPIPIPPVMKIFHNQKTFDSVKVCDLFTHLVETEVENGHNKEDILAELQGFNDQA